MSNEYNANRERYYRNRKKIKVLRYLHNHPCVDCGQDDVRVLDFDHVKGKKTAGISQMVSAGNTKWEKVEEEIKKCEVRCANCHRTKTIKEPLWFTDLDKFEKENNKLKETFATRKEVVCGTPRKYAIGCRCNECKAANAQRAREYRGRLAQR